ncbi:MAG: HD domain-containing protein [Oscillospiraceae bacterium]|nr:HD domain-containing protein [Oscillospiraceae bacterium]
MHSFDFVPVKLRTLPLDVYLECKIYSGKPEESDGTDAGFSLLCENQTVTQRLLDRLKRAIFPDTRIYIDRQYVIGALFSKGHYLGFSEADVTAIRNHENPWEKKKRPAPIPVKPAPKPKDSPKPGKKIELEIVGAKIFQDKLRVEKFKKTIEEYNITKDIAENMINTAAETGKVDKKQGEEITRNIQKQVNSTETALVLRAINQIRSADEYLHTHCMNVAYLNGLIGKWLEFDEIRQNELVETGLFHDLGKTQIAPEIMQKVEPLEASEFDEMKKHPVLALEMLMKSGMRNKAVLEGVIQHHERVNGTGYPKGLAANDICEYARITAISDTYDAMVTRRVHAESHSPFRILHEFEQGSYSELDFRYVNVFISCMVEELKGKEIIMNDGREAIVLYVNPSRLLYPIVEIDGTIIKTDDEFYCARMKNILEDD